MRQKCNPFLRFVDPARFIQSVDACKVFHLLKTLWKLCKTGFMTVFSTVSTKFSTTEVEKFST